MALTVQLGFLIGCPAFGAVGGCIGDTKLATAATFLLLSAAAASCTLAIFVLAACKSLLST